MGHTCRECLWLLESLEIHGESLESSEFLELSESLEYWDVNFVGDLPLGLNNTV